MALCRHLLYYRAYFMVYTPAKAAAPFASNAGGPWRDKALALGRLAAVWSGGRNRGLLCFNTGVAAGGLAYCGNMGDTRFVRYSKRRGDVASSGEGVGARCLRMAETWPGRHELCCL